MTGTRYRKKRQRGYGKRRQSGYGLLSPALLKAAKAGGLFNSGLTARAQVMRPEDYKRLALRRKMMRGRGAKWDAFKSKMKKFWGITKPIRGIIKDKAKDLAKQRLAHIKEKAPARLEDWAYNSKKGERLKDLAKIGSNLLIGKGRRRR